MNACPACGRTAPSFIKALDAPTDGTPETDARVQDGYTFCGEDLRPAIEYCKGLEGQRNELRRENQRLLDGIREAVLRIQNGVMNPMAAPAARKANLELAISILEPLLTK